MGWISPVDPKLVRTARMRPPPVRRRRFDRAPPTLPVARRCRSGFVHVTQRLLELGNGSRLVHPGGRKRCCHPGDGWVGEEVRQEKAICREDVLEPREQAGRHQRVPSKLEEVVVSTHLLHLEE